MVKRFIIIYTNIQMLQWNLSARMDRTVSLNKQLEEMFLFSVFIFPPKLS